MMVGRVLVLGSLLVGTAQAQAGNAGYRVGVVSESGDIVTWFKPNGSGLTLDRVVPVGLMPSDVDGPHNITVSPDGNNYYVSLAHGTPYGSLWKLTAAGDSLAGRAQVELFPTTISVTPDGQFAFVAHSDFHGDHPRGNVGSGVHTPAMNRITHNPACDMPHGIKVNHEGTRVYVSCMHSDEILQLDVATFTISRRAKTGDSHSMAAAPAAAQHQGPAPPAATASPNECSPTFVSVSPDDKRLYVACNSGNSVQVWDAVTMTKLRDIPVGKGAYNVEPSPDGSLVIVTNKKDQSVSLIDAGRLSELARIPTSKKIVHGVAYSPDQRFAYITCESIGADPGAVDVIDLAAKKVVASVSVPAQPTGITILRLSTTSARQ